MDGLTVPVIILGIAVILIGIRLIIHLDRDHR